MTALISDAAVEAAARKSPFSLMRPYPAVEVLREYLIHDQESGKLIWRKDPSPFRKRAGKVAGSVKTGGYIRVQFRGRALAAHRIAYKLAYGVDPEQIDHIDGDTSNNRLSNLRSCTQLENSHNRRSRPHKGLLKGVYRNRDGGRFTARLKFKGQTLNLGTFATAEDAAQAHHAKSCELLGDFVVPFPTPPRSVP